MVRLLRLCPNLACRACNQINKCPNSAGDVYVNTALYAISALQLLALLQDRVINVLDVATLLALSGFPMIGILSNVTR